MVGPGFSPMSDIKNPLKIKNKNKKRGKVNKNLLGHWLFHFRIG